MGPAKGKEIELAQQISFLKKISFFHDFDDHELRQFLAVSRWIKIPRGTLVIKEDTSERIFYILVKGEVSVFKTDPDLGEPLEITTLSTGDCFGEMSLVAEVRRTAGVITTSECYILMVEPDIINASNVFLQLKFYKRFGEILVSRLISANQRMMGQGQLSGAGNDSQAALASERREMPPVKVKKQKAAKVSARASVPEMPPPPDTVVKPASFPQKKEGVSKLRLQRRIRSDLSLAINGPLASKLGRFLTGPCENTRKFTDQICLDPCLSSRVLQMANSSFFRRTTPVVSVPHAIIIVGIKDIQNYLLENIEESREIRLFAGEEDLAGAFWRHSVVVGRIAQLLRDVIRVNIADDVYMAGLLHNLGILVLDRMDPDFYPHLARADSPLWTDLAGAEKDYFGVDHGQAGRWMAEKMGLPQGYQYAMHFHHAPERAMDHGVLVALVHLAVLFAADRGIRVDMPLPRPGMLADSFAWVIIQEQHRTFLDVNVTDFIQSFNAELDNTWNDVIADTGY